MPKGNLDVEGLNIAEEEIPPSFEITDTIVQLNFYSKIYNKFLNALNNKVLANNMRHMHEF